MLICLQNSTVLGAQRGISEKDERRGFKKYAKRNENLDILTNYYPT